MLKKHLNKKRGIIVFILIFIVSNFIIPSNNIKAITSNYLQNADFESGMTPWRTWNGSGKIAFKIDNQVKSSGGNSIKAYTPAGIKDNGSIYQRVELASINEIKAFQLSQWIKTSGVDGHIASRVRFVNSGGEYLEEEEINLIGIASTENWKKFTYNIAIPENAQVKAIVISYTFENFSGSAWFDNTLMVKALSGNNRNLILNGGFEGTTSKPVNKWIFVNRTKTLTPQVDNTTKKEGLNSLKLSSSSIETRGFIQQYLFLSSCYLGKTIKISQWLKNTTISSVELTIKFLTKDNLEAEDSKLEDLKISSNMDWTYFSSNIDIPNNKNIAKIMLQYTVRGSGSLWIDDVRMEPYTSIKDITTTTVPLALNVGETKNIALSFNPTSYSKKTLKYTSADTTVAKVVNNAVTGLKKGITKVTVEEPYQGKKINIPVVIGKTSGLLTKEVSSLSVNQDLVLSGKVDAATGYSGLKYSLLSDGVNGYVVLNSNGSFQYYPNKGFYGKDSFAITIKDGSGRYSVEQFNINVVKVDSPPVGEDFVLTLNQGESNKGGKLNIKNFIGNNMTFAKNKDTINGTFTISSNGTYTYTPKTGFYGYDNVEIKVTNDKGKSSVVKGTIYVAPSAATINSTIYNQHPRVLVRQSHFDNLKLTLNGDIYLSRLQVKNVDPILNSAVVPYSSSNFSVYTTKIKGNIEQLSFMYRITGDTKYAERAWKELENICVNYPNWNDKVTFLDTSTMALSAAIGYDWLYDYLSDSQKKIIEKAITEKALNIASGYYKNNTHFFVNNTDNWNIVCNSAMGTAAMAIYNSTNSATTMPIIQESIKSIQNSISTYFSDGSSGEGPIYFGFEIEFLIDYISTIEASLNISNPFSKVLNYEKMASYLTYITGDVARFNYSDSEEKIKVGTEYRSEFNRGDFNLWFAKKLNKAELTAYSRFYRTKVFTDNMYSLLWYDKNLFEKTINLPLDTIFKDKAIATMRSDFDDTNTLGTFLGFKGGLNGTSHGDLDVGAFVYDVLGERWAIDLGRDNYSLPGYFDDEAKGVRWTYYNKRAEGHNTLLIGSSRNEDQIVGSKSNIIESSINTTNPYGIIDMTPAYSDKALKVNRKFQLLNNRTQVSITDTLNLKSEEVVTWQMHTRANATIINNGKEVVLEQNGKTLKLKLTTSSNMVFEIVDTVVPYQGVIKSDEQYKSEKVRKIIAKGKVKNGTINVLMTPGN